MRYCSHEDVGAMLTLDFNADSKPTDAKVSDIIGWISSEVNIALRTVGIEPPAEGTDLYSVLTMKVSQGSAGIVSVSFYGNTDSVQNGQGAYCKDQYEAFLLQLKTDPDSFKEQVKQLVIGNQFTDGSMTDVELDEITIDNDWIP